MDDDLNTVERRNPNVRSGEPNEKVLGLKLFGSFRSVLIFSAKLDNFIFKFIIFYIKNVLA